MDYSFGQLAYLRRDFCYDAYSVVSGTDSAGGRLCFLILAINEERCGVGRESFLRLLALSMSC